MRRTKDDAAKTRRDILRSAMNIFYEKGYSKTTFDEIAKRINLTKGAVYWYFRNKPDIVAAIINEFTREYLEHLKEEIPDNDDVSFDDIIRMNLVNNKRIREDDRVKKFIFFLTCQMEWSESIITKIKPLVEETKNYSRNIIFVALQRLQKNKKIKPDINLYLITEILITMYSGMLEAYMARRIECDLDEMVVTGYNLIYNSIKMEGSDNEN